MTMLQAADAQARLLALAPPLSIEQASLAEAAGRWAAADVVAQRTQPAADLSAMDGYALRFADLQGTLTVVGESKAGGALDRALAPGEAARIFTGAAMPAGADTVLVQEEAARDGDLLRLAGDGPARPGAHVRRRGMDFAGGDRLITQGERLSPARIALAAIGGHGALPVRRRPRICILSTGDELVAPGSAVDGLPASNGPMLMAMLAGTVTIVASGDIVPDRLGSLVGAFRAAADCADIVVTTGGASVGDHDLVRPALIEAGATIDFWRVAMRPGKPVLAGRLGDAVVLGLPGNPVSAFVTAQLFLLPLVAHLAGCPDPLPAFGRARLAAGLPAVGERTDFLRGRIDGDMVHPLVGQDSAALAMLAQADALIVRPGRIGPAAVGDPVDILRIA
ncbi:molybdopterin molybdotransferase MoeA [Sphingomonas nostoxanthinifaciens]|uniref:molybdopterin molybdotransferase MoeA n=1 Tax=Sphingomonas nostoxanthinifaciens TaxID=2872652 RepID=UPI001CC1CFE2|nr:gephyrin-like molybdotransferase Glp [Sphingomonas nostoxanthinifaciens]UAK25326.1 molybdopterin molybdotransferase MoeA [Sphingomonas nostoxanthinifaciens]